MGKQGAGTLNNRGRLVAKRKDTRRKERKGASDGPFVSIAAICERVLQEADNTLSAIRIIDKVGIESPPTFPPGTTDDEKLLGFDLWILIVLRSPKPLADCPILLTCCPPSGRVSTEPLGFAVAQFAGGASNVNLRCKAILPYEGPGLYWFDVEVANRLVARMPLGLMVGVATEGQKPQGEHKKPKPS